MRRFYFLNLFFFLSFQREETKTDLEKKVEKLREENEALEAELANTNELTIQLEVETANMREAEVKRQTEELNALKKANQVLKVCAFSLYRKFVYYPIQTFNAN